MSACITCPRCGATIETRVLLCPRCREPLSLSCDGDCRACAAKGHPVDDPGGRSPGDTGRRSEPYPPGRE